MNRQVPIVIKSESRNCRLSQSLVLIKSHYHSIGGKQTCFLCSCYNEISLNCHHPECIYHSETYDNIEKTVDPTN